MRETVLKPLLTIRSPGRCPPPGHTLLEVLLALGLSLILLTAAYSSIDLYRRASLTGQQQAEELQVARALFDRLARDVRSVASASTFVGEQDALLLAVSDHGLQTIGGHETNPVRMQSTLQHVLWTVGHSQEGTPDPAVSPTSAGPSARRGLARLAREQIVLQPRVGTLKPAAGFRRQDILAPEVVSIRFRYFDGSSWFEYWNGQQPRRLPRAVEITISLSTARTNGASPSEHRLVVAVPGWEATG